MTPSVSGREFSAPEIDRHADAAAAEPRGRRPGVWWILLAAAVSVQVILVVAFVVRHRVGRQRELAAMAFDKDPGAWLVKNDSKPIVRPTVLEAREADLRPDELIVGIEIGGHARAYRLAALEDPSRHVVNDIVGTVPVSVVYCNMTQCLRVYTDLAASEPLDVEAAGVLNGELVVRVRGALYLQNTGAAIVPSSTPASVPYSLVTPVVATWSEWARRHPDTDVYEGRDRLSVIRKYAQPARAEKASAALPKA
jgi:Protein of unknown function (DUF3179)